jgi:thioester reductase-like protein
MQQEDLDQLCCSIASIYHCAAEVNMIKSYDQMQPTNVDGTKEIVRLASTKTLKKIHYASTLSVFVATDQNKGVCTENDRLENTNIVYGGYAQTKWAAEYYLNLQDHLEINIFRFGLITGHSKTGAYAQHDYLEMFVKGMRKISSIPETNLSSLYLDATPVDYVAKAMVCISNKNQPQCYHIANTQGFSLGMIINEMQKHGVSINKVNSDTWQLNANHSDPEVAAAYMALCRLLPNEESFDRYRAMDLFQATDVRFDQKNTLEALKDKGISCPKADVSLLKLYMERILND